MKKLLPLLVLSFLAGCASQPFQPVPEGYTGPTASVADSYRALSSSKVEFFYVEAIDEHPVDNSRFRSLAANRGRGMTMAPVGQQRDLPADKSVRLALAARTEYAAPILALTREVFQVKGPLEFTPEGGKRYVVKGVLGADRSAVWLEEEGSGKPVGQPIEAQGSAKLGLFDK
ncbi:hypothetical protein [Rubrivivax gelatinosus]|uniref:Lipoprotein n=1 Tax=Rubrivivax gelatinosus TaxID=28068 RepID=A0ABS1E160_RUBGE|nr:hypothetical protein [Rubrivivax gelatinosus]MBK1715324.1 hypothetical protein [Rubrivivax gelatinosus]